MKRYDTSQASWVDVDTIKRYDATQQSWVDVDTLKRYDSAKQSWVEAEGGFIKFKLGSKQTYNVLAATVGDNGLSMSVKFGAYYKDYITFVADGLNIPGGSTVTLDYFCTDRFYALAHAHVYLTGWNNGTTPYTSQFTPSSGSVQTLSFDTPTNYGSICRIDVEFRRADDTWTDNDPHTVTVSNVVVGNKKFKFPIVSL